MAILYLRSTIPTINFKICFLDYNTLTTDASKKTPDFLILKLSHHRIVIKLNSYFRRSRPLILVIIFPKTETTPKRRYTIRCWVMFNHFYFHLRVTVCSSNVTELVFNNFLCMSLYFFDFESHGERH